MESVKVLVLRFRNLKSMPYKDTPRKRNHQKGYVLVYAPTHPFQDKDRFVPEHRLVLEKKLGRIIDPKTYEVHHKDRNVRNNKLPNLELLTHSEHRRIHHGWKRTGNSWFKPCKQCGKNKLVDKKFFYFRKNGQSTNPCKSCFIKNG